MLCGENVTVKQLVYERYMDEMIQGLNDILVSPVEQLGNKSYIMEV